MLRLWVGVTLITALFGTLLVTTERHPGLRSGDPEWPRKILHIGMGIAALCAPRLFANPWPFVLLTAGFTLFMVAARLSQPLKKICRRTIHGVGRKSLGDICFPFGVGLLCLFSRGDSFFYGIPMLILTLADAAAALVGRSYGRLKYANFGSEKSLEGSLAFFTTSWACVFVPLFLFSELGLLRLVTISLTLSLVLALVEAVSGNGLDNLVVPLAAYFLLRTFLFLPAVELLLQLAFTLILTFLFAISYLNASLPHSTRARIDYGKWTNAFGRPGN